MFGGGGFPYDVRRNAYIQTYMDYTDDLNCRMLHHFLAKLDARKSDDSNMGAIQSLQEIQKVTGGGGVVPPP